MQHPVDDSMVASTYSYRTGLDSSRTDQVNVSNDIAMSAVNAPTGWGNFSYEEILLSTNR